MATIKSFTSLEQSKKLEEILPLESADMVLLHEEPYETSDSKFDGLHQALCISFNKYDKSWRQKYKNISYFPCWSLTALLNILQDYTLQTNTDGTVFVVCESKKPMISDAYDNPIDACYAMIIRLNELKML